MMKLEINQISNSFGKCFLYKVSYHNNIMEPEEIFNCKNAKLYIIQCLRDNNLTECLGDKINIVANHIYKAAKFKSSSKRFAKKICIDYIIENIIESQQLPKEQRDFISSLPLKKRFLADYGNRISFHTPNQVIKMFKNDLKFKKFIRQNNLDLKNEQDKDFLISYIQKYYYFPKVNDKCYFSGSVIIYPIKNEDFVNTIIDYEDKLKQKIFLKNNIKNSYNKRKLSLSI